MAELKFKPFVLPLGLGAEKKKLRLKPFALAKKIRAEEWAKALGIRKKPAATFDDSKIKVWLEEKEAEKRLVLEEKEQQKRAQEALSNLKYRELKHLLKTKAFNTKGKKEELLKRALGNFTCDEIFYAVEKLQKETDAKQRSRFLKGWDGGSYKNWISAKSKILSSENWN